VAQHVCAVKIGAIFNVVAAWTNQAAFRICTQLTLNPQEGPLWEPYDLVLRQREWSVAAAFVALVCKLARKRFDLLKNVPAYKMGT
jgi:hypothetical protein